MNPWLSFFISGISLGVTFLFGCVGEILTEKVGHLNLGIPGIMCIGGTSGCVALALMHGLGLPWFLVLVIAILASFLGGVCMGLLYSFLTVTLKANQNVTGLAMTILGAGLTKAVMYRLTQIEFGQVYLYALKYFRFPFQSRTDDLGKLGIMVYLGIVIAVAAALVLSKMRIGLHLRAVGENPGTADAVGINVTQYKYLVTMIGSGIAALGGLFYIMNYQGTMEAYKSIEGLGWLAVALVIFTLWKPALSILGSFVFGILYIAGTRIPTLLGIQIHTSVTPLLEMLPYVVTIVILIVISIRKKREHQPPASLGLPYFREER